MPEKQPVLGNIQKVRVFMRPDVSGVTRVLKSEVGRDGKSRRSNAENTEGSLVAEHRGTLSRSDSRLTRHKISDRWRGRVSLPVECGSHRMLKRGAASGSLHRLVRRCNA